MHDIPWMLYGATGFTGQLIAAEAVRRGHRPVLAGRAADRLAALAAQLGLQYVTFDLHNPATIARHLANVDLVLHAAGPFTQTSAPMLRACLATTTHYLDITGEITVFEQTFRHDQAARAAGVVLISGVGFDVVPTDCLASLVASQVPGAVELETGIDAIVQASSGTLRSMLEVMKEGGMVRHNGVLTPFPLGNGARHIRIGPVERLALPFPWGDLSTAYRTTGIPTIRSYLTLSPAVIRLLQIVSPVGQPLVTVTPIRRLLQHLAGWTAHGPDATMQQQGQAYVWARAIAADGRTAEARLQTPEVYRFTACAAVRYVEKVLTNHPIGALTPAQAAGADMVFELEGVQRLNGPAA